jgi:hypothetical protein
MHEGLLWYDPDQRRPTRDKIDGAAERFRERMGRAANCCHVHPAEVIAHPGLHVVADARLAPHHFWVGVDETLPLPARAGRRRQGAA